MWTATSLASLDIEGAGLREYQDLFQLYVSDYVTSARCRVSAPADGSCMAEQGMQDSCLLLVVCCLS